MVGTGSWPRVLIVDEESGTSGLVPDEVRTLRARGVDEALERLASTEVDCVVADQRRVDGIELFGAVRDADSAMTVVLVDERGVVATRNAEGPGVERLLGALEGVTEQGPGDDPGADRGRETNGLAGPVGVVPRYDRIVETLGDPLYMLDRDGTLTYVNEATTELLGREEGEIVGEDFSTFLPDDDVETSDELVADLVDRRGTDVTFEMAVVPADDEPIPVENHVAVRRRDGEFVGTVGVLRDITERKRRESDLQQYETIIHALAAPVYATDEEGYFTFVNPTFETVSGYPAEQVVGEPMHFEEVIPGEDADRIRELVGTLLSSNDRTRGTLSVDLRTRDGRTIPVEDSIALLPHEEGFSGAAGVLRDVSDRRQEQQRLEVMNRVLRHNVRNQMNVIAGSAETVIDMAKDPTVEEIARSIVRASEEMTSVSNNVRELQAAIDREEEVTVDLVELVEAVLAKARENYPDAAIVSDLPQELFVDAGRSLGYALQHVVENAIEHNDGPEPSVEVVVEEGEDSGWGRIRITDDGPGIPEQDRAVITGATETDPLQHGSGLGLWIVNWIVESFDGRIEIDRPDPGGTTVSILLPGA